MRNLGGMLKSRDAMLLAKLPQSRLQLFHRSCTDVRAGPWETWALRSGRFQTAVLEETLESPWTTRRSNQSTLKETSPGCSLEGLMLKQKLQHFGQLMRRADLWEKTPMLGKIKGGRRRGRQRLRWLGGVTNGWELEWAEGDGEGQGGLVCRSPWGGKEWDTTEPLNNSSDDAFALRRDGSARLGRGHGGGRGGKGSEPPDYPAE